MNAPAKTSEIDRVDDSDHVIGTIPRGRALAEGANFRTVHVFLFDRQGRLLLQRLAPTRERHPGRWGSSVAAYPHAGEAYRDAAQRRLWEELGLRVSLELVARVRMRDERSVKFVALFVGWNGGAEIREPDHIAELRYWEMDELDAALAANRTAFTPTFAKLFAHLRAAS